MKYLDFKNKMDKFPVFSKQEIKKNFPDINNTNLQNWQKKNYLLKLKNNWYTFTSNKIDEYFLFYIANKIYAPSYISLETALSYYNLIPETSFSVSSVSTLKTIYFSNKLGRFFYSSIKKEYFFAYKIVRFNNFNIKIAEIEKSVLDFLYLHKDLQTFDDIKALRLNIPVLIDSLDFDKINNYAKIFNSKVLFKKIDILKKLTDAKFN